MRHWLPPWGQRRVQRRCGGASGPSVSPVSCARSTTLCSGWQTSRSLWGKRCCCPGVGIHEVWGISLKSAKVTQSRGAWDVRRYDASQPGEIIEIYQTKATAGMESNSPVHVPAKHAVPQHLLLSESMCGVRRGTIREYTTPIGCPMIR